jgi:hypothetical protein
MKQHNINISMAVDNCSAHLKVEKLSNMTVTFLPPKATFVQQPLDLGIIKNFKSVYTKPVLTSVAANIDDFQTITEFLKSVNVLDVVLGLLMHGIKVTPNWSLNTLPKQVLWLIVLHQTNKET